MDINAEKVISELDKIISYIADKMQLPFQKAYEILLKRCYFDMAWAIVWIFVGIGLIVGGLIFYKKVKSWTDGSKCKNPDSEKCIKCSNCTYRSDLHGLHLFSIIFWFFGLLILFVNLYTVLEILISPEWYMFEKVLELIQ